MLNAIAHEPAVLKVERNTAEKARVTHQYLVCDQRDKVKLLQKLSRLNGMQALVFVRDIGNLSVYAEKLAYHHVDLGILHGEAKKWSGQRYYQRLKGRISAASGD